MPLLSSLIQMYMLFSTTFPILRTMIIWIMGTLSNDPAKLEGYAGQSCLLACRLSPCLVC